MQPAPPTSPLSAADKTLFVAYVRSVWLLQAATQCYGGSSVGGFFGQMNGVLLILVLACDSVFSKRGGHMLSYWELV